MGTTYDFVCEDCKVRHDVGKLYNSEYLVPNLIEMHKGHNVLVYDDSEEWMSQKYESDLWGRLSEYTYYEIWKDGKYIESMMNLPLEWDDNIFYEWYENQDYWKLKMKLIKEKYENTKAPN